MASSNGMFRAKQALIYSTEKLQPKLDQAVTITDKLCPKCTAVLLESGDFYWCTSIKCRYGLKDNITLERLLNDK